MRLKTTKPQLAPARPLAFPPLYVSVLALQLVVVITVAFVSLPSILRIPFLLLWPVALALTLYGGFLMRRDSHRLKILQWLPLVTMGGAMFVWFAFVGFRALLITGGLGLLLGRNLALATRRALYFDLAIVLAIFYDTIGIEASTRLWPFAIAFLVALVFVLMTDYSDRRLAYVRADDAEARAALAPDLRNAALATALVLAASATCYALLPQPEALQLGIPTNDSQVGRYYAGDARGESAQAAELLERQGNAHAGRSDGRSSSPARVELDTANGGGGANLCGLPLGPSSATRDSGKSMSAPQLSLLYLTADRPLYVRTHALGILEEGRWKESADSFSPMRGRGRFFFGRSPGPDRVRQRFEVNAELDARLPLAYRPDRVAFPSTRLDYSRDLVLRATAPKLISGTEYYVLSLVQFLEGRPSGGYEMLARSQEYLGLPSELDGRIANYARSIVGGHTASSQRANALEAHLRQHYAYGAFTADEEDPVPQFLFTHRKGGSAQFATSLAVLLRVTGVPSRVAAGYRARRLNPLHGDYELWEADRHCWVEAYVEGRWTVYEPSPWVRLPPRYGPSTPWDAAQDYVRLAKTDDAGESVPLERRPSDAYLRLVLAWGWAATYGVWILLGLVLTLYVARRYPAWLRPVADAIDLFRLRRRLPPRECILNAYRIVERAFSRRALRRAESENHTEYLQRAARAKPHLAIALQVLSREFAGARYDSAEPAPQTALRSVAACREIMELLDERAI